MGKRVFHKRTTSRPKGYHHRKRLSATSCRWQARSKKRTRSEIEEKNRLYFDARADEIWICDLEGRLFIYLAGSPEEPTSSALCPSCLEKLGK